MYFELMIKELGEFKNKVLRKQEFFFKKSSFFASYWYQFYLHIISHFLGV